MKIWLDLRWARGTTPDGIGRVSLSLAAALLQQSSAHEFSLLCASAERADFVRTWLAGAGVTEPPLTIVGADARALSNRWRLPRLQRAQAPQLYFSPYYLFHPPHGIPSIAMVHDLIPLRYPDYFKDASLPFRLLMTHVGPLRLLLRAARQIVTVSRCSAQDLTQLLAIEPERMCVIYPGVSPFEAHPQPEAVLQRHGLPFARDYLLSVGRPEPYKNFRGLIQAYALLPAALRQRHPLLLVGPEHPRQTPLLQAECQRLGLEQSVFLSGGVDAADLPAFYQQAALFVFPSLYEGFGLPVLEAMAAGLPVLCSDQGSLPEAAGGAARLHDPRDLSGWAQQMQHLLEDPAARADLRQRGLARAADMSWARMARELLALFETCQG